MAHWIRLHPQAAAQTPTSMVQCVERLTEQRHQLRATETATGGLLRPELRAALTTVLDNLVIPHQNNNGLANNQLDAHRLDDRMAVSVQAGRASNNNEALLAVLAAAADPRVEWLVLVVPDRYKSYAPYAHVVGQLDALAACEGVDLDLRAVAVVSF